MARGKIPKLGRVTSRALHGEDDWWVTVEWIDDEGYRVSGHFRLAIWGAPPRAVGEETQAILNRPPIVTYASTPSRQTS